MGGDVLQSVAAGELGGQGGQVVVGHVESLQHFHLPEALGQAVQAVVVQVQYLRGFVKTVL